MPNEYVANATNRRHVGALAWNEPATDFWFNAANSVAGLSAATAVGALQSSGWVSSTSPAFSNAATGDLISAADDTPAHFLMDTSGDKFYSPIIFGDYAHALLAGQFLGYTPTKLNARFYAAFTVASASETASFIGFTGGATAVSAIISNATNFLGYNSSASSTLLAVDNAWHLWDITLDSGGTPSLAYAIDGVAYATTAVVQDLFPCAFGMLTTTTNRIGWSWAHIWYS
jgi:hypothetical protein